MPPRKIFREEVLPGTRSARERSKTLPALPRRPPKACLRRPPQPSAEVEKWHLSGRIQPVFGGQRRREVRWHAVAGVAGCDTGDFCYRGQPRRAETTHLKTKRKAFKKLRVKNPPATGPMVRRKVNEGEPK